MRESIKSLLKVCFFIVAVAISLSMGALQPASAEISNDASPGVNSETNTAPLALSEGHYSIVPELCGVSNVYVTDSGFRSDVSVLTYPSLDFITVHTFRYHFANSAGFVDTVASLAWSDLEDGRKLASLFISIPSEQQFYHSFDYDPDARGNALVYSNYIFEETIPPDEFTDFVNNRPPVDQIALFGCL